MWYNVKMSGGNYMNKEKIGLLRKGKLILCESCKKGHFYPANGMSPDKASLFICDYCKGRLFLGPDIIALRKGEPVLCTECGIGTWKPMHGMAPDKASYFMCDHCGEKLHLYYKRNRFPK